MGAVALLLYSSQRQRYHSSLQDTGFFMEKVAPFIGNCKSISWFFLLKMIVYLNQKNEDVLLSEKKLQRGVENTRLESWLLFAKCQLASGSSIHVIVNKRYLRRLLHKTPLSRLKKNSFLCKILCVWTKEWHHTESEVFFKPDQLAVLASACPSQQKRSIVRHKDFPPRHPVRLRLEKSCSFAWKERTCAQIPFAKMSVCLWLCLSSQRFSPHGEVSSGCQTNEIALLCLA